MGTQPSINRSVSGSPQDAKEADPPLRTLSLSFRTSLVRVFRLFICSCRSWGMVFLTVGYRGCHQGVIPIGLPTCFQSLGEELTPEVRWEDVLVLLLW